MKGLLDGNACCWFGPEGEAIPTFFEPTTFLDVPNVSTGAAGVCVDVANGFNDGDWNPELDELGVDVPPNVNPLLFPPPKPVLFENIGPVFCFNSR